MELNNLIKNIKTKLLASSFVEKVIIEDKTYLHIKHLSHDKNKFHLKLTISSKELKKMSKLDATKKISVSMIFFLRRPKLLILKYQSVFKPTITHITHIIIIFIFILS